MPKQIIKVALLFLMFISLCGCAAGSQALLAEDYKAMNNENLLRYYYTLGDEIERQERKSSPQFSVGIGGFGGAIGAGAEVGTGGTHYTANDLRARRIDVLMEMKKRGLNP
ncbi:MAG TPA: hypothetical protein PLP16_08535 [Smithellaceae bacterium]|nr:hypothetical protein [Smithellaceae bacterium]